MGRRKVGPHQRPVGAMPRPAQLSAQPWPLPNGPRPRPLHPAGPGGGGGRQPRGGGSAKVPRVCGLRLRLSAAAGGRGGAGACAQGRLAGLPGTGQGAGAGQRGRAATSGRAGGVLLLRRRARLAQGQCEGQEGPLEWIRRVVGPAPSTAECATPYRSVFVGTIFNCPGAANGSAPQRQRALSERASNSC